MALPHATLFLSRDNGIRRRRAPLVLRTAPAANVFSRRIRSHMIHAAPATGTSLFDFFAVEADLGPARTSDAPAPVIYKKAPPYRRPLGDAIFEPYRTQTIHVPGARLHGTALVESTALASVPPPFPRYQPHLEPSIVSKGILSLEQLEAIIYAGEQHSQTFQQTDYVDGPDGIKIPVTTTYRAGFLIGDGTGVGKGRSVAGILRDNFNQGRTRAVWFSANELLRNDAIRDWTDLGGDAKEIIPWSKTSITEPLTFSRGILYGSYAMLRSRKYKLVPDEDHPQYNPDAEKPIMKRVVSHTRLDQLIDALGSDFDGVIAFDEAHQLANAAPTSSKDDVFSREASQQGEAALELQKRLPNARFVYISATAASRLDAFAYAQRLRLWGSDAAFTDRQHFLKAMTAGGAAAMEVVCRDLKALGRLVTRQLSYEGVTYQRITHELDYEQIRLWNSYTAIWRMIDGSFQDELVHLGAAPPPESGTFGIEQVSGSPRARLASHTSMTKQRFFQQALLQMKMPTIIEFIKERLAAGRSIVLQFTHTNEAQLDRALSDAENNRAGEDDPIDLETLELSQRDILIDFIAKKYPIHRYRLKLEKGKYYATIRTDNNGEPIVDSHAVARREALIDDIRNLVFPDTALEMLYDAFGEEQVAEVTGRSKKLVRHMNADGAMERVLVKRGAHENQIETDAFNDGKKRILAFSEAAGGLGRSYHADVRFGNSQPRTHIFLEMSWRADSAIQGMGRTHRTGQVCPPEYVFATTTVPGEKRFSSTPARRIAAFGALSRGQREAGDNGLFRAEDNLETEHAQAALRILLRDIRAKAIPDITPRIFWQQTGIDVTQYKDPGQKQDGAFSRDARMTKFLNRVLQCDIDDNGGFQQRLMDEFLARLDAEIDQAIAQGRYDRGVETFRPAHLNIVNRETLVADPSGATTELLTLEAQHLPLSLNPFAVAEMRRAHYEANNAHKGRYVLNKGKIELHLPPTVKRDKTRAILPVGERTYEPAEIATVMPITDLGIAEATWGDAISHIPLHKRPIYVVTGALTPIWNHLPGDYPTIYRMQTDTGERLLAQLVTETDLIALGNRFGLHLAA